MKRWCRFLLCLGALACLCAVGVAADTDTLYHRQRQAAGVEELPRHLPADVQQLLEQILKRLQYLVILRESLYPKRILLPK